MQGGFKPSSTSRKKLPWSILRDFETHGNASGAGAFRYTHRCIFEKPQVLLAETEDEQVLRRECPRDKRVRWK
jgi:hypothetical protein